MATSKVIGRASEVAEVKAPSNADFAVHRRAADPTILDESANRIAIRRIFLP